LGVKRTALIRALMSANDPIADIPLRSYFGGVYQMGDV
jgi:hypothetical protein